MVDKSKRTFESLPKTSPQQLLTWLLTHSHMQTGHCFTQHLEVNFEQGPAEQSPFIHAGIPEAKKKKKRDQKAFTLNFSFDYLTSITCSSTGIVIAVQSGNETMVSKLATPTLVARHNKLPFFFLLQSFQSSLQIPLLTF